MKRYHILLLVVVALAQVLLSMLAFLEADYVVAVLLGFLGLSYIPLQLYQARRGSPPDSFTLILPVSAGVVVIVIALLRFLE
ncbi:MAG: hypothetical protein M3R24_04625 [Chloroflexota bacterium]|nr:hypothetical protein [Chloroflexota bacterium]